VSEGVLRLYRGFILRYTTKRYNGFRLQMQRWLLHSHSRSLSQIKLLQTYILDAISSYSVMATGLLVRFCQQASSMSSEEGACLSSSQQTPTSNTNNMNLIWLINWRQKRFQMARFSGLIGIQINLDFQR